MPRGRELALTLAATAFAITFVASAPYLQKDTFANPIPGFVSSTALGVVARTQPDADSGPRDHPVAPAPLKLPAQYTNVTLTAIPDRLVNEPLPAALRRALTLRGVAALASVEMPALILWTERGTSYSISSWDRTIDELIAIAEDLR